MSELRKLNPLILWSVEFGIYFKMLSNFSAETYLFSYVYFYGWVLPCSNLARRLLCVSAVYQILHCEFSAYFSSAKHICHQDTKTQKKIKFHRRGAEHAERTFLFNCLWEEGKWKTISLRQKINRQLINFKAKIQFILIRNHAIRRSDLCFARRAWVLLFAVFSTANNQ